ncbi:hypothetical protein GCM10010168_55890 [Actinoplanes ianthinogenes]|uniref:Uncharacterized protein n=1 Tax=Actinoplanes ianthinogenes TaxID=122358 RepID=A0ABM7LQ71_9ACTN|nr:hypothetical protein [Actinoplanes ianthinogenes]BCJ41412.1 hypothetical protein Aiant_20690 [Actinoplanes ianthinogenes]GGR30308.1 hypothetical protein GCM10010168_55890 [Actinoplanes ianthinogenes]
MADPEPPPAKDHHGVQRPGLAIALLSATALASVAAIVVSLGRDALTVIAATLTIASALTLIAFQASRGRRR